MLAVPEVEEEASVEIVEDRIEDTSGDTGCVEIVESRRGTRHVEVVEASVVEARMVDAIVVEARMVDAIMVEASGDGEPPPASSEEVADLRREKAALEAKVLLRNGCNATSSMFKTWSLLICSFHPPGGSAGGGTGLRLLISSVPSVPRGTDWSGLRSKM